MDRRGFFRLFGAGVAGIALEQAIPLGRVWSFPSKIVLPKPLVAEFLPNGLFDVHWYTMEEICAMNKQYLQAQIVERKWNEELVRVVIS